MKRSKKAGGYNLRKSLAWDRAFLTEEGVLNDSELSLISGTVDGTDSLSVIDEHGKDSLSTNSSSANLEILEEDLFKELPHGYPNKRNASCRSPMKQESIISGGLASASKSTQKVAPLSRGLKKAVCKNEVCSSPMTSVSQKRLSSAGTKQISTRNSKIPKVPVSKKNSSVPSITTIHSAAGGSSLIPQSAWKVLGSKLPSKTKHAFNGVKSSLESVPKSNKPAADLRNDVINSASRRHSLMSHRAQQTTKVSKCSEISSSQGLVSGVADMVKSCEETSSTAASSRVHFDNAGLNKINVQAQGLKPSGLRMPSPSLRFFSETKAPVSNTLSQVNNKLPNPNLPESTIPTSRKSEVAYHNHDFKHTQHGASNVDAMGKARLCSQNTDKCSTSLIVAPKKHSDVIHIKCNQQAIEVQAVVGDKNAEATKDEQSRCGYLDTFEIQYKGRVSISSKVDEKNSKDDKSVCSDVEFEEANNKAVILLQENTTNRSVLDEFHVSFPEAQLVKPCDTDAEVHSQQLQEVEVNSAVLDNDATLESQTNSISQYNNLMLAPDSNPSRSIADDSRTSGHELDQPNCQQLTKGQFTERNLRANDNSVIEVVEEDSASVPACTDNVMADNNLSSVTGICNADCSVAGGSKFKCVDDEQVEVIYACNLPTMVSESVEVQDKAIENHDMQQRNSTNSRNHDTKDICAVNLEVVAMSSHCDSNAPELLNEVHVEFDQLGNSDQDGRHYQSSRHGISDNYTSVHDASIANIQDTSITKDSYAELDKQQILNENLVVEELNLQKFEADLNYSTVLQDSSFRISQSNNSKAEVQDQIGMLNNLSNKGNDCTLQTTHLEFQSSGMSCMDQLAVAVVNSDSEEFQRPVYSHEIVPQEVLIRESYEECIVSDKPGSNLSPKEARSNVSQHVENITDESTCNTEAMNNEDAVKKQRIENQKSTRPPPNVVPFSDEWLAVIESAGEEILTLKTGPVKHSPPDKSTIEPSPWSPVKRVIGPFDCTKYTNAQPDNIN